MVTTTQKHNTVDDLLVAAQAAPDRRFDMIEGELYEMSPAGARHGRIAARLIRYLDEYIEANTLGDVYTSETGFRVTDDTVIAPDAAFVAAGRLEEMPVSFPTLAPDLAVEVVSPSDTVAYVRRKIRTFLQAGTRSVWVVYPQEQAIEIHHTDTPIETFHLQDTLRDEAVLPGFALLLTSVFGSRQGDNQSA